ncbi:VOC family protein [Paeniglutamicibacter sp. ABSL32-1]|uniref:VOC family protein n=1 Tax=Paeniglutamicibacter quisquiliarum TaxID=2849498 RepID=UPI001C2D5F8E|nr:VOC family protein [Paeniglutamicibacter quisquiliarum]MBV1777789.1 VOC family protein [Paeniglutamicibacter quisquiliarum]
MGNTSTRRADRIRPTRWVIAAILAALAFVLAACGTTAAAEDGPSPSALGPGLRMGPVELVTSDLDGLHRFYTEGVGLTTISSDEDDVVLGTEDTELFRLIAADSPDAAPDDYTQAGLYHSAFLFPDEAELAASVLRTAKQAPASFQGSSDHKVSKAFYFADPEGNGVELYVDTPENTWEWNDGLVTMGSAALEPNAFIAEHLGNRAPAARATTVSMGHVHLRGGDLRQAEEFYEDGLGFAVTARSEGAIFLAANGYHHHLAVNTWSSSGAGKRPESLGLRVVSLQVADDAELDAIAARLTANQIPHELGNLSLATNDPWGSRIIVRVED